MQVIHSIWDTESFYIWSESSGMQLNQKRSVKKKEKNVYLHPFASEASDNNSIIPVTEVLREQKPLEECLNCFWQRGIELDCLEINPRAPEVEFALLSSWVTHRSLLALSIWLHT